MSKNTFILGLIIALLGALIFTFGWTPPSGTMPDTTAAPQEDTAEPNTDPIHIPEAQKPENQNEQRERIDDRLLVRVLDARTLEPVAGAVVGLRRVNSPPANGTFRVTSNPRLGQWHKLSSLPRSSADDFKSSVEDLLRSRMLEQMRRVNETLATQSPSNSGLLSGTSTDQHGMAVLGESEAGQQIWATKGKARGSAIAQSSGTVDVLIEAVTRVLVLDARGRPSTDAKVTVEVLDSQGSRPYFGSYLASALGDGMHRFTQLWSSVNKNKAAMGDRNSTVTFRLVGDLNLEPVTLGRNDPVPNPIVLREASSGSIQVLIPWMKDASSGGITVSIATPDNQILQSRNRPPFVFERLALRKRFRLEVKLAGESMYLDTLDGPAFADQVLTVTLPTPEHRILLIAKAMPSKQSTGRGGVALADYSLLTSVGEVLHRNADRSGKLLFAPRFTMRAGMQAQIWKEENGEILGSRLINLDWGVNGRQDLGEIKLSPAGVLLRARAVDQLGNLLRHARIEVRELLGGEAGRSWHTSPTLRTRRDSDKGLVEVRGLELHRRMRLRASHLDGYTDSEWVECRTGAGVIDLVMRQH